MTSASIISLLGNSFAQTIQTAVGVDALVRSAREDYLAGRIEARELDARLQAIIDKFGILP